MFRRASIASLFLLVLALPFVLFAQPVQPPVAGDEVGWVLQTIQFIVKSFQTGAYVPAVAALVMVAVVVLQRLKPDLGKAKLPWISALLGLVITIAVQLTAIAAGAKPADWLTVILVGLVTGPAASGFWGAFGKWLLGKLQKKAPAPVTPP